MTTGVLCVFYIAFLLLFSYLQKRLLDTMLYHQKIAYMPVPGSQLIANAFGEDRYHPAFRLQEVQEPSRSAKPALVLFFDARTGPLCSKAASLQTVLTSLNQSVVS
jgi:hypothetical protein